MASESSSNDPLGIGQRILTLVGAPSLLVAVMYYFGWTRTESVARAVGVRQEVFALSVSDYVLRAASAMISLFAAGVAAAAIGFFVFLVVERSRILSSANVAVFTATVGVSVIAIAAWFLYLANGREVEPVDLALLGAALVVGGFVLWVAFQSSFKNERHYTRSDGLKLLVKARPIVSIIFVLTTVFGVFTIVRGAAIWDGQGSINRLQLDIRDGSAPEMALLMSADPQLSIKGVTVTEVLQAVRDGEKAPEPLYEVSGLYLLLETEERLVAVSGCLAEGEVSDVVLLPTDAIETIRFRSVREVLTSDEDDQGDATAGRRIVTSRPECIELLSRTLPSLEEMEERLLTTAARMPEGEEDVEDWIGVVEADVASAIDVFESEPTIGELGSDSTVLMDEARQAVEAAVKLAGEGDHISAEKEGRSALMLATELASEVREARSKRGQARAEGAAALADAATDADDARHDLAIAEVAADDAQETADRSGDPVDQAAADEAKGVAGDKQIESDGQEIERQRLARATSELSCAAIATDAVVRISWSNAWVQWVQRVDGEPLEIETDGSRFWADDSRVSPTDDKISYSLGFDDRRASCDALLIAAPVQVNVDFNPCGFGAAGGSPVVTPDGEFAVVLPAAGWGGLFTVTCDSGGITSHGDAIRTIIQGDETISIFHAEIDPAELLRPVMGNGINPVVAIPEASVGDASGILNDFVRSIDPDLVPGDG